MKLYEIDSQIEECIDFETGEILDTDKLNALEMEREEKIENVACWYKDLKAEAEALKAEKMAFAERQRVAENKAESIKKWLAYALDGEKFKSAKASVSFRKSESVEVTNLFAVMQADDTLVKYAEPTPDKTAIKEAIKAGRTIDGALIKTNMSVIVK